MNEDAEVRSDAIGKEHAASVVKDPKESPWTGLISCPPAGGFGSFFDQAKNGQRISYHLVSFNRPSCKLGDKKSIGTEIIYRNPHVPFNNCYKVLLGCPQGIVNTSVHDY